MGKIVVTYTFAKTKMYNLTRFSSCMMLNRFKIYALILFTMALLPRCDTKVVQIPISDFFKTPQKSFFKISPDGKYIAYLKPYKERQNLFIESLADGRERMATSFNDYPIRDYYWRMWLTFPVYSLNYWQHASLTWAIFI